MCTACLFAFIIVLVLYLRMLYCYILCNSVCYSIINYFVMTFGKSYCCLFCFVSSSVYTDDSTTYSRSLPSADPEPLLKAPKGVEPFGPPDSSTATAAGVDFMVEGVVGSAPDSSVHKPVGGVVQVATTTEEEENVSGWFPAYCNDVPPGYVFECAFNCMFPLSVVVVSDGLSLYFCRG